MILFLYTTLYRFTLVLASTLGSFNQKIAAGLSGRRGMKTRLAEFKNKFREPPYWFHVASSGELEQCLPLLDEVKRRFPTQSIYLSYFSPTGKRATELEKKRRDALGLSCPWDAADFSPWDLPKTMRSFLAELRPKAFITIHREIWPNLLLAARAQAIPCYLFATSFPDTASSGIGFYLIKPWLSFFSFIATVDEKTAIQLKTVMPPQKVEVLGDPRVERVWQRKERRKPPAWRDFFLPDRTVFILASLWPEDWKEVGGAVKQLAFDHPDLRFVLAPHELHGAFVQQLKTDVNARLWSHFCTAPDFHSSLILDSVGELAEMFQVASFVFVGGSFKKKVHNVLEPAAYGVPILTGPRIQNSAEAVAMSSTAALKVVSNRREFSNEVKELLTNPQVMRRRGELALAFITSRRGTQTTYIDLLSLQNFPGS